MKQEMPAKRKTILMDIDGTIFYHKDNLYHMVKDVPVLLDGTIERLLEWRAKEYYIVLTTERPEGIFTGHLHICKKPVYLVDMVSKINEAPFCNAECPYGDGNSGQKICDILKSEKFN